MNVFKTLKTTKKNICINAVAGSGKTFTIVSACKRLHEDEKNVLFLAFNKSIATELGEKLEGLANVSTLHAFGFSVLKSVYNGLGGSKKRVIVDKRKYFKYVKENIFSMSHLISPDEDNKNVYTAIKNVLALFDLARLNLIHSGNRELLETLCDRHGINCLFDETSIVDEMLADAYVMGDSLRIDFTDMIIYPLSLKKFFPHYKYVFVDECQDLSNAQRELMLAASAHGRFIAVGDRKQAINGFCGADCESFDKIAKLPNTIELPLSVNYRCGKNMVKLAKEIVPQIKAHYGAIAGKITHVNHIDKDIFRNGDMVLCRMTFPLVSLCIEMIERNIAAVIKGNDIAVGIRDMISRTKARTTDELKASLKQEREKCIKSLRNTFKFLTEDMARDTPKYIALDDKCKCLEAMADRYNSIETIKVMLIEMFSDENKRNVITLSTVHKAKGLESDRVLIVCPDKLPMTRKGQQPWEVEQENNLKYVAVTRAKKELVFVDVPQEKLHFDDAEDEE